MIVRKTWERYAWVRGKHTRDGISQRYRDVYTGWFLLGVIPLFISRVRAQS